MMPRFSTWVWILPLKAVSGSNISLKGRLYGFSQHCITTLKVSAELRPWHTAAWWNPVALSTKPKIGTASVERSRKCRLELHHQIGLLWISAWLLVVVVVGSSVVCMWHSASAECMWSQLKVPRRSMQPCGWTLVVMDVQDSNAILPRFGVCRCWCHAQLVNLERWSVGRLDNGTSTSSGRGCCMGTSRILPWRKMPNWTGRPNVVLVHVDRQAHQLQELDDHEYIAKVRLDVSHPPRTWCWLEAFLLLECEHIGSWLNPCGPNRWSVCQVPSRHLCWIVFELSFAWSLKSLIGVVDDLIPGLEASKWWCPKRCGSRRRWTIFLRCRRMVATNWSGYSWLGRVMLPSMGVHSCRSSGVSRRWITSSSSGMLPRKAIGLAMRCPWTCPPYAPVSKVVFQTRGCDSSSRTGSSDHSWDR